MSEPEGSDVSFKAKYETTCAKCREPIKPGQEIETYGMTADSHYERFQHVDCLPSVKANPRHAETVCPFCGGKWADCPHE